MTPKLWFKMVGGMLLIFVIGMFAVSTVRTGSRHVTDIAAEEIASIGPRIEAEMAGELSIPVAGYPFRMNGKTIGTMTKLKVDRSGSAHVDGYSYTIQLNEGVDVNDFAGCELVPLNPGKINADSDWHCMTSADAGFEQLENFGSIDFKSAPGSHVGMQTHRLMVPQTFVESVSSGHAGHVEIESGDNGVFRLTVNGKKVVDIIGNDAGGTVTVRNPKTGETVVQIHGDAKGNSTVKVDSKAASITP